MCLAFHQKWIAIVSFYWWKWLYGICTWHRLDKRFASVICTYIEHFNGSVQVCSNSIANALELLQSCTKPSICKLTSNNERNFGDWVSRNFFFDLLYDLFFIYYKKGICLYKQNTAFCLCIWVRSWNCGFLVTWFCYQLIAKPGNKTATVSWTDPYVTHCKDWHCKIDINDVLLNLCCSGHKIILLGISPKRQWSLYFHCFLNKEELWRTMVNGIWYARAI